MSIISKETWEKFTPEEREKIKKDYQDLLKSNGLWGDEYTEEERSGALQQIEWLFGKENLRPKPKIKTWGDVKKITSLDCCLYTKEDEEYMCLDGLDVYGEDNKLAKKLQATIKITKLIELGYGGIITAEEYLLPENDFYCIWANYKGEIKLTEVDNIRDLLVFRDEKIAEEFMSYSENVELVKQYYMI